MSQISIKIGIDLEKSKIISSEYDMPESHIKFEITGNTAAKIINSAAGLAKNMFLDKIIEQIKENFDIILRIKFKEIIKNIG